MKLFERRGEIRHKEEQERKGVDDGTEVIAPPPGRDSQKGESCPL